MQTGTQCDTGGKVERNILIAVDTSPNARRAVLFVGDFFGRYPGIRVTILNIILEPEASYFASDAEQVKWLSEKQTEAAATMADYQHLLLDSGFAPDKVHVDIKTVKCPSVADYILAELKEMKYCTVVVGRRGISRKEEFIFGSTSNKILHEARNCAIMVIS